MFFSKERENQICEIGFDIQSLESGDVLLSGFGVEIFVDPVNEHDAAMAVSVSERDFGRVITHYDAYCQKHKGYPTVASFLYRKMEKIQIPNVGHVRNHDYSFGELKTKLRRIAEG